MPSEKILSPQVNQDLLISPSEARRRLSIGKTTYYAWVKKGWLKPCHFSPRLVRVRAAEVDALADGSVDFGEGQK